MERVFFKNGRRRLAGIIHTPDNILENEKIPCIIVSHGLTSNKENKEEWANRFNLSGFAVLLFDFSGHGESDGKFENMTIKHYESDLKAAIKYVRSLDYIDPDKIGLTGHSLGGSLSMIAASNDKKIKSVAAVSPTTDWKGVFEIYDKLGAVNIKEWKKKGYIMFKTKKLRYGFYKEAVKVKFDKIVKRIKCSALIIHGENDGVVPVSQSKNIIEMMNEPKKLIILKYVGHYFVNPKELDTLKNLTQEWFQEHMKIN
ncbi:alpha/beta hydrolase [Candidatus Aenigmatarchaeota archaeon]